MADPVRILVVGVGNMGVSHAKAYHKMEGFEIVGLVSRSILERDDLPEELAGYPRFSSYEEALACRQPGCRFDQHLAQHPRRVRDQGPGCRLPCVHGKADRD